MELVQRYYHSARRSIKSNTEKRSRHLKCRLAAISCLGSSPPCFVFKYFGSGFVGLAIDTNFGAGSALDGGIRVNLRVEGFDSAARLVKLRFQGRNYAICREGARLAT